MLVSAERSPLRTESWNSDFSHGSLHSLVWESRWCSMSLKLINVTRQGRWRNHRRSRGCAPLGTRDSRDRPLP
jgi:hypothetical protein